MPDKQLFEYAVIRVVPRMEREEFINVGVVLYARQKRFLEARTHVDAARLLALCPTLNVAEVAVYLRAFEGICAGAAGSGPIGGLSDPAARFRWLTATRSTVVQTSKVHPGMCNDPQAALAKLFEGLVL